MPRNAVLFLWECIITTGDEVAYFWHRKPTGAAALFFLNKYLSMGYLLMNFIGYSPMSDQVRPVLLPYHHLVHSFICVQRYGGVFPFARLVRHSELVLSSCARYEKTAISLEGLPYLVWACAYCFVSFVERSDTTAVTISVFCSPYTRNHRSKLGTIRDRIHSILCADNC